METFKENYLKRCTELSLEPLTCLNHLFKEYEILNVDKTSNPNQCLQELSLNSISLSLKQCDCLASCLSNDKFFVKANFADAFLGDDGCIKITTSLKSNSTLVSLDLRGNSIRSDGAISIAQMLKINNTLKWLYL